MQKDTKATNTRLTWAVSAVLLAIFVYGAYAAFRLNRAFPNRFWSHQKLAATLAGDRDLKTKMLAMNELIKRGGVSVPGIIEVLERNDHTLYFGAQALARIGDLRATEPLAAALGKGAPEAQLQVAEALALLGDQRAIRFMKEALEDKSLQPMHGWIRETLRRYETDE